MTKLVEIFTDGSCLGNPGQGGYGIILRYKKKEKILSKGYFSTTNNRMELMAAIIGLESLKQSCTVLLTTDSQYLKQGITKWIHNWKQNQWKRADNTMVSNIDLWKRLDLVILYHHINWCWVKGHSGHYENDRCNILAKNAANIPTEEDLLYIKS